MNDIYVLDRAFKIQAVIDNYVSCIWRPSYSGVGDFELYLGASANAVAALTLNSYLVRSSDVYVDASGKITFKKVMIVKNIEIITSNDEGDYLNISGRELKYIMHQRIIFEQMNFNNNAESAIREIITANAISPINSSRKINKLQLAPAKGFTDAINKQVSYEAVDEAVSDICLTYNYGWDVYISDNKYIVEVYQGLDRSYNQVERPYVVFSDNFENLVSTDYQLIGENYANLALIAGEGEGINRKTAVYATEHLASGLDLYETYVDARDISSNNGEISSSTYTDLLFERGKEKLSELSYTEGFSGEVLSNGAFRYGVDFDLGDVVTVVNSYGISKNVRVLSAIESDDENGSSLLPQFNI